MTEIALALPETAPGPKRKQRRKPRLLFALLPLLLLGGAWVLVKAGIVPVEKWADKSPGLRKALAAIALSPQDKSKEPPMPPQQPPPLPRPVARPASVAQAQLPAAPHPVARTSPPRDNSTRVARILATMDTAEIVRLFAKMPDAEIAPLLLKMKASTAGEIIAALPTERAVTLTRYLRRYGE